MDIIDIIEKYIELSVRRDNLKNTIENSKRNYAYAKIEGDMAYNEKDYKAEKSYNDSARSSIMLQEQSEKELAQVEQLLEFTHQKYEEKVRSLNELELNEALVTMSVKKSELERHITELSQRRSWAISKGDAAYANRNYDEEREYNHISSECFSEIERLKPTLHYYEAFVNDLNNRLNKGPSFGH